MGRTETRRQVTSLVFVAVLGVIVGLLMVGRADAAGPPEAVETRELNVDADGLIKIHEQGVADVRVTNTSLTADVAFPTTQTVDGTVGATQSGTWNVGISGTPTVNVANFPAAGTRTMDFAVIPHAGGHTLVPSDVVVTDVLVSTLDVTGDCTFIIFGPGGAQWFRQPIGSDDTVVVNLTTGFGPVERLGALCSGGDAYIVVTWTGYTVPS